MKNQITVIKPEDFGLTETTASEISKSFESMQLQANVLKEMYAEVVQKEISPELCKEARDLRLKLVKNRTNVIKTHKAQKAFYLAGGRFVDAYKNKCVAESEIMESELKNFETHYERIEEARKQALRDERNKIIDSYGEGNRDGLDTAVLSESVFAAMVAGLEQEKKQKEEEARLEAERIEAAKKEAARIEAARIEAERLERERIEKENERIRQENEMLKAEQEKKEKAAGRGTEKSC